MSNKPAKRKPMVEVIWEDSAAAEGSFWRPGDRTISPVMIRSVGYVHERTKKKLVLIDGYHSAIEDSQVSGLQVIPASAIRKVRKLRAVQKRKAT